MEQVKLTRMFLLSALVWAAPAAGETVILDPGHGGEETGTQSANGVLEKTVVLKISRYAAQILKAKGVSVRMTRTADTDRSLPSRPKLANQRGARVFVSVHANWSPVPSRRGLEVYVIAADSADAEVARLVEREGAHGGKPAAGGSDLSAILGELKLTKAHEDSGRLARRLEASLKQLPGLSPSRGLRQAPFAVLKGARMPAVLVELGYLSNPAQARYLNSDAGQRAVGRKLAQGILRFLRLGPEQIGVIDPAGGHGQQPPGGGEQRAGGLGVPGEEQIERSEQQVGALRLDALVAQLGRPGRGRSDPGEAERARRGLPRRSAPHPRPQQDPQALLQEQELGRPGEQGL